MNGGRLWGLFVVDWRLEGEKKGRSSEDLDGHKWTLAIHGCEPHHVYEDAHLLGTTLIHTNHIWQMNNPPFPQGPSAIQKL